jgi:hypothetical protein
LLFWSNTSSFAWRLLFGSSTWLSASWFLFKNSTFSSTGTLLFRYKTISMTRNIMWLFIHSKENCYLVGSWVALLVRRLATGCSRWLNKR